MPLVLTRKVGEALIITSPGLPPRRLYVVSIEGNTVRLSLDAPDEVQIIREELLPEEARRRWREDRGGKAWVAAAILALVIVHDPVVLAGLFL